MINYNYYKIFEKLLWAILHKCHIGHSNGEIPQRFGKSTTSPETPLLNNYHDIKSNTHTQMSVKREGFHLTNHESILKI